MGHFFTADNWLIFLGFSLAFVSLVISAILFVTLLQLKKRSETQLQKLEATVSILTTGSLGMGKKMLLLEEKFARLKVSQSELQNSTVDFSYSQAQRLISEGVANEAIAANSGLSATEINLMRLLHSQSANATHHV